MAIIPPSQARWKDVRIERAKSYDNMSESIVITFMHHGAPYSIVERIPYLEESPRTAAMAIYNNDTIKNFITLLVNRYFRETMTPMNDDDASELAMRIAHIMYMPPIQTPTHHATPPPQPSLDPDISSALSIADEGMKLQKEIIEKTTRYQKKVKDHYQKYGSAIPSLHK